MEKDKSAVEDFLEGIESDHLIQEEPIFSEEAPEVIEEKPLPFNKDPKIQKYIEREVKKHLEERPQTEEPKAPKEEDDFYARLIGNDTPEKVAMIREYKQREEKLLEHAEERAFNRLSQKEQEERRADQAAEEELTNAFDTIEETFDVDLTSKSPIATKTRQEFVSFVEKIAPKDKYGEIIDYPDMNSAWETFQEIKKANPQPNRAKDLAARSMARSSEAQPVVARKSSGQPFQSTDDFLDSLSK